MSNDREQQAAHARQTATSTGSNLVNQVLVQIQRVEMYYHNDDDGTYPRCMFPYSTDSIRMQAIVWARPVRRGARFQPYTLPVPPHTTFDYDDHWCSFCAQYPRSQPRNFHPRPDIARPSRPTSVDTWSDHHLDLPQNTQVQNWPGHWPRPQFIWQELICRTPVGPANQPRDYTYQRPRDIPAADTTAEGWAYVRTFPAGTRRFRVKVTLPAQTVRSRRRAASGPHPSSANTAVQQGFSVHMCVREGNLPQSVPAAMQDFVRWATMFLEVPYEVGGHFIGGRQATAAGHPDGYDGCGLDCTGLVSIAGFLAEFGWSPWRISTGAQNRPIPATPVQNPIDVQPGDVLDRPDHVRIVYDVQPSPSDPNDRQVRVIEAASSAAGKVRMTDWGSIQDMVRGTHSAPYNVIRPDTGASSAPGSSTPAASAPASPSSESSAPASSAPTDASSP